MELQNLVGDSHRKQPSVQGPSSPSEISVALLVPHLPPFASCRRMVSPHPRSPGEVKAARCQVPLLS